VFLPSTHGTRASSAPTPVEAKGSMTEMKPGVWRLRVYAGRRENGTPIQLTKTLTLGFVRASLAGEIRGRQPERTLERSTIRVEGLGESCAPDPFRSSFRWSAGASPTAGSGRCGCTSPDRRSSTSLPNADPTADRGSGRPNSQPWPKSTPSSDAAFA
jgi:hypothetical protein